MAGAVSRWLGSVEGLSEIAQRLLRVQIENAPAIEIVQRYDTPDTLFYLDPPYVHASRADTASYGFEMTHRSTTACSETGIASMRTSDDAVPLGRSGKSA